MLHDRRYLPVKILLSKHLYTVYALKPISPIILLKEESMSYRKSALRARRQYM